MAKRRTAKSTPTRSSKRAQSNGKRSNGKPAGPDLRAAFDLVMQLMAIPGKSGKEAEVVDFISRRLREAGAKSSAITTDNTHKKTPLAGQVGNLIFKLPGTVRRPRRLLMAHIDTVPICVGCRPVRKGNLVHAADADTGLGGDDRAGAAVILQTAMEILRRGLPHPPLTFLWPVQEEVGLHGARNVRLTSLGKIGLAFNWDGGAPEKLTIGATGGFRIRVEISGLASHAGGAPEKGVSAIAIASLAIADLVLGGWHGDIRKGSKCGTSNVGVIRGGAATNVVTDLVELRVEARSHDTAFRKKIVSEIEKAFRRAAKEVRSVDGICGKVTFASNLDYESFRLKPAEPCVQAAQAAVRDVGLEPELAIANGGLDANWMTHRGVPTVSFGCGQLNIHTVNEQLDVSRFQQACRIALRLATDID